MTTYSAPKCFRCKHFNHDDEENNTCTAFPDGVPNKILYSQFDHTEPYPDADNPQDNGITFEPIEDAE